MSENQIKKSIQYIFTENQVYDQGTKKRILNKITNPPQKKRRTSLMPIVVTICLLLGTGVWISTILSNSSQNQNLANTEEELPTSDNLEGISSENDKIAELEFQVSTFEDEREYYHEVIAQILPSLSDEEMLNLAKSHFRYELSVNQTPLTSNGKMEVEPGEVDVMLTFWMTPHYNVLSDEWYQKGMISGDYFSHIEKVEPDNGEVIYADGANVTAQGYKFTNMQSGSKISLKISEELRERLSLDTNEIEILVK
ncbi:hypothetical protein [Ureibacillus endophyticus]|uniref:Uncharacterized protein n=1 Tax=Ureibacillus endophyticus TaxID=1978490 RepID=A0A494YUI6_9BACL|nr:hypothetical protein [Lysinibacillus endophyticus]RKQ13765.1 hypothetical protein D8M03_15330 [Lysinibacillus endophyticus]